MPKHAVSIAGASGYAGGELLRLLLGHPHVELRQVTSEQHRGKPVSRVHPNLRKATELKFCSMEQLDPCDLLFASLPHGRLMGSFHRMQELAPRMIDLSGDFRLREARDYDRWYGAPHACPEMLDTFVYGICEIHRERMRAADYVSSAGCNATAVILPLYPLFRRGLVEERSTVVEVKAGSSQGGATVSEATHHAERKGAVRTYKPCGHRHIAEMIQELRFGNDIQIHFTATSIDMVRGVHAVCHVFPKEPLDEKNLWQIYREDYGMEPFIRIVKEINGIHRQPEPKFLAGSNFCDIGFEKDPLSNRVVIFSAIDNLMKGAAGQAVQAFNIMNGFDERTGLEFTGLHPV
ncbi:MAG: N-acetyl-gamma-glutamyl-phosphate reductase [Planctomycetota bacterium]